MNFSDFILAHDGDDLARLALSRERYVSGVGDDFDLALTTLEVRRKLRDKVPEWFAAASLRYPLRVSGEQCSSTVTARYKASVASAVTSPGKLADLTGGLGVDCWAFAQVFDEVLYNEMRPELAEAAAYNFRELGMNNIRVRNCTLVPGISVSPTSPGIPTRPTASTPRIPTPASAQDGATVTQILGDFRPDVLFLDPARRAGDGRKVFRLEDCQPDVLQLLPELLAACPHVLLKLSPMADISQVCNQLSCVKAVHVVAADGECKELLLLLEKDWSGRYSLTVFDNGATMRVDQVHDLSGPGPISGTGPGPTGMAPGPVEGISGGPGPGDKSGPGPNGGGTRSSGEGGGKVPNPEAIANLKMIPEGPDLSAGQYLFEPGKALLKAGAFDLPCRFGLTKIGRHTHLFTGREIPEALRPFGKCFRILEVLPLDKRSLKAVGRQYPKAEVTARNIPLTSDQLRAKLGVRSGGSVHVFGVHQDAPDRNLLIVAGV